MKAVEVYELFKNHLTNHNFHFESHDEDLVIYLTVHGEDLPQPTIIRVLEKKDIVQVISPIPARIPEDKRVDAAIAVAIANYGIVNGSFDYDMSDGEIRFRITQSFDGADMSDDTVLYLLACAFTTTDHYNDRFFMLGKGLMTLEQFMDKENED